MQPSNLPPLACAELTIERATVAAFGRLGAARTMAAQLQAARVASCPDLLMTSAHSPSTKLELIRLAGLLAVRAATADDDMRSLQLETLAAVDALDEA